MPQPDLPVVGSTAPDFSLRDHFGQTVTLSGYRGASAVAIVFFPLAFTGTCTGELCELRDNVAMFRAAGVQLLGISVDSTATLREFAEREGYDFPLLADFWPHGEVARAYEVFNDKSGFPNRGTFVIDKTGHITFAEMNGPGEARDQALWEKALSALDS